MPAFYEGCTRQLAEVQAIFDTPGVPTFENTIVALEKSGQMLMRVLLVFYNKSSSDTNDDIDAIEEEIAPKLAVIVDSLEELDGLSANEIEAAAAAAHDQGLVDKWLIGMVNFTDNPVLDSLTNRELRKKIMV